MARVGGEWEGNSPMPLEVCQHWACRKSTSSRIALEPFNCDLDFWIRRERVVHAPERLPHHRPRRQPRRALSRLPLQVKGQRCTAAVRQKRAQEVQFLGGEFGKAVQPE